MKRARGRTLAGLIRSPGLPVKTGGNWKGYKSAQLQKLKDALADGKTVDELMADNKYYDYYKRAYTAVLGGMVGEYEKEAPDKEHEGQKIIVQKYGLKAYCPIAEGFGYSHYDDFGDSRSYGYRRRHLGNDLLGAIGTPIVAVEGGVVEAYGWNQYGGWRLGIRSFDGKRSYYYAHLRKGHPYQTGIKLGSKVKAGQVIGYLGSTGYSTKEDNNGMTQPHLHIGLQLIFDESQKEGINQIWLNLYPLIELFKTAIRRRWCAMKIRRSISANMISLTRPIRRKCRRSRKRPCRLRPLRRRQPRRRRLRRHKGREQAAFAANFIHC